MEVEVLIQRDDAPARVVRLVASGPMTVGRSPQATLCLEGDLVSRTHAVLELKEGGVLVEDRSSNGTMVGEEVVHRNAVWAAFGTPIVVGPFALSLHPVGAPAPALAPIPTPGAMPAAPAPRAPFLQRGTSGGKAIPPAPPIPTSRSAPPPAMPGRPPPTMPPPPRAPHLPPTANGPVQMPAVVAAAAAAPAPSPASAVSRETEVALRREIHARLLENLDLAKLDAQKMDDPSMRPRVLTALRRIVQRLDPRIPPEVDRDQLIGDLADEALGLGPLERYLADPSVSEVMVVDPSTVYIERGGRLVRADARFTDDERVRAVIERIVTPLGRRIDESSPLVDARLKDGSRVNAVIRPLALRGSCITIRKFARTPLALDDLVRFGALTPQMARFLVRSVVAKRNVVISGGTGSGKTTLLNVLSGAIPEDERIVTIEDAAELQLSQSHVVSLETRPANMEGRGEYTIRDLVKNALRMRPDRIVVGECRGGEALDMLQAMNTGHDGSLTTTHANSPEEAIARLETLVLMGGVELPSRAIREQIAGSIHLVVQQSRFADGSRRIAAITEVTGIEPDGTVGLRPIFEFVRTGTGQGGKVVGEHRATGYLPSFLDVFIVSGLVRPGEPYL